MLLIPLNLFSCFTYNIYYLFLLNRFRNQQYAIYWLVLSSLIFTAILS